MWLIGMPPGVPDEAWGRSPPGGGEGRLGPGRLG